MFPYFRRFILRHWLMQLWGWPVRNLEPPAAGDSGRTCSLEAEFFLFWETSVFALKTFQLNGRGSPTPLRVMS